MEQKRCTYIYSNSRIKIRTPFCLTMVAGCTLCCFTICLLLRTASAAIFFVFLSNIFAAKSWLHFSASIARVPAIGWGLQLNHLPLYPPLNANFLRYHVRRVLWPCARIPSDYEMYNHVFIVKVERLCIRSSRLFTCYRSLRPQTVPSPSDRKLWSITLDMTF